MPSVAKSLDLYAFVKQVYNLAQQFRRSMSTYVYLQVMESWSYSRELTWHTIGNSMLNQRFFYYSSSQQYRSFTDGCI